VLIEESKEFDIDPAVVWKRASDIERIPEYWHGTKSIAILGRDGPKSTGEVRFAFGGEGEVEITVLDAERTVTINYVSGPFAGVQTIKVGEGVIDARWEVKFKGLFRLASSWNAGHFRSGTVHALERLSAP
jgi:hypothetical protein